MLAVLFIAAFVAIGADDCHTALVVEQSAPFVHSWFPIVIR